MSEYTQGVETFDCQGCGGYCYGGYHMESDKDGYGDWVKAEDYRALREKLEVAEEALGRIPEVEWWEDARSIVDEALAKIRGEE